MTIDEAKLKFPIGSNVEFKKNDKYKGFVTGHCEYDNDTFVMVDFINPPGTATGIYAEDIK